VTLHGSCMNYYCCSQIFDLWQTNKQTPWPLVCKRTILTERPPLVGEF
jgi:hypothetical protein